MTALKRTRKETQSMSDSIKKELNSHDIAKLFAEDIKRYADVVGSLDDLSATNVYNGLEGYEQKGIDERYRTDKQI